MYERVALIRFPSHHVQVSMDQELGTIYCFKYTDDRCDLQSFTDQEAAGDYILEPMPDRVYRVCLED